MRCEELLEQVYAYTDGQLDAAQEKQIRAHLSECRECAGRVREQEALLGKFRESLREDVACPDIAGLVMPQLAQPNLGRPRKWVRAYAFAAALVAIAGTWLLFPRTRHSQMTSVPRTPPSSERSALNKGASPTRARQPEAAHNERLPQPNRTASAKTVFPPETPTPTVHVSKTTQPTESPMPLTQPIVPVSLPQRESSTAGLHSAVFTTSARKSAAHVIGQSAGPGISTVSQGSPGRPGDSKPAYIDGMTSPEYTPPTYMLGASLNCPIRIDVDEFGRMYVLDIGKKAVFIFAPDGSVEAVWRDPYFGEDTSVVRRHLNVVASDMIFLSGSLWESPSMLMDVLRIGPGERNGVTQLPDTKNAVSVGGRLDGGFWELHGRDDLWFHAPDGQVTVRAVADCKPDWWSSRPLVDERGHVYLFSERTDTVHIWDENGQEIQTVNLTSRPDGDPKDRYWDFAIDTNGDMYANLFRIYRFDSQGGVISKITPWFDPHKWPEYGEYPPAVRQFQVRNGMIYALLQGSNKDVDKAHEIQVYAPSGRCIARYLFPETEFNCPTTLAVQHDGSFAVGEYGNETGEACFLLTPNGRKTVSLQYGPKKLLALSDGSFYALRQIGQFRRITPTGELAERISEEWGGNVYALWPGLEKRLVGAICPSPTDGGYCVYTFLPDHQMIYYTPSPEGGQKVEDVDLRVISRDGSLVRKFPVSFSDPDGLAMDKLGNVYAAIGNAAQSEVIKFDPQGKQIAKLDRKGWHLGEVSRPTAVLVDDKGNLLVLDSGNSRVQVFDPNLQPIGAWGSFGSGKGQLDHPHDMCFGPNNTLWIADTINDRIVWISLDSFWQELTRDVAPPVLPAMLVKRESLPKDGQVALNGVITSDSRDGAVYAQHPTGSWGVRLLLAKGLSVERGKAYKIAGNLAADNGDNLVTAKSLARIKSAAKPKPISMANACIAKPGKNPTVQSGVLVATWGQVTSVDKANRAFTVSDGSMGKEGITVECGKRVKGGAPVKVGEYVALTGVAVRAGAGHGVRIREDTDIRSLGTVKPEAKVVAALGLWHE